METLLKEKKFSEGEVRMIMEQALLALDFFEQKKIIHRDIKPDNILIRSIADTNEYEIRLADFGLSIFTSQDELVHHRCGTPGYVAPEMFETGYSYKSDIFSLGSVFFSLLTGCYLFAGDDQDDVACENYLCNLDHVEQYVGGASENCKDLLYKMLTKDPENRPSAKDALLH